LNSLCYTVSIGDTQYDPAPILRKTDGWDYVCLTTNDLGSEYNGWTIRNIDRPDAEGDRRASRHPKMFPEKYFPEYKVSLYCDATFEINGDLSETDDWLDDCSIVMPKHHTKRRDCYDEIRCQFNNKDLTARQARDLFDLYEREGYRPHRKMRGLTVCGFILRRHHDPGVMAFMEKWWDFLCSGPERDMISFDYLREKHKLPVSRIHAFRFWTAILGRQPNYNRKKFKRRRCTRVALF